MLAPASGSLIHICGMDTSHEPKHPRESAAKERNIHDHGDKACIAQQDLNPLLLYILRRHATALNRIYSC